MFRFVLHVKTAWSYTWPSGAPISPKIQDKIYYGTGLKKFSTLKKTPSKGFRWSSILFPLFFGFQELQASPSFPVTGD